MGKILGILGALCLLALAFGCGASPTPPPITPPAPSADSGGMVDEYGNEWRFYESDYYGIRLAVPNPENCVQATRDEIGHIACDYGDLSVEVFAFQGFIPATELRGLAVDYTRIPGDQWEPLRGADDLTGYSGTEAWGANDGHRSVIGVLGQSGVRDVSHIVFVSGSPDAMSRHATSIERLVGNLQAI